MNELKVFEHGNVDVVDSRQVAKMTGKQHKNLLRDIAGYIEAMKSACESSQLNFEPSDFFIESVFEKRGKCYPCYLMTKKGCDMVANKMTGEKGVLFTAAYVTAFEEMREKLHNGMYKESAIEERRRENSLEAAKLLNQIAADYEGEYRQILQAHAVKELTGEFLLPLPEMPEETYTAKEIGEKLGISANMVGRIANEYGLKSEEYGKWFVDKSRYSNKEVRTFRYFHSAVKRIGKILESRK